MPKVDFTTADLKTKKPKKGRFEAGFKNLFASTTVAAFGGSVSIVAVNWIVWTYTHNPLYISYLGLAEIVPAIILGLLAGVIADRYDKKMLMVTSDVVRAISMGFLAIFFYFVGFSYLLIIAVILIVYTLTTFFLPASQAILPMLIGKDSLENANGMLQGSLSTFQSVGSAAGGLIVAAFGAVWGLGINSMTYGLSAIFLFNIVGEFRNRKEATDNIGSSMTKELTAGIKYMRAHLPILEGTFLGGLTGNFFGSLFYPFFVVYVGFKFGGSSAIYGYLVAAIGIGMALGSLMVGRIRGSRYAGVLIGVSMFSAGGIIILFAMSNFLVVSLIAGMLAGLTFGLINTVYFSTVQAIVPTEILARVLSIDSVGSFSAIPAGLIVGGILIHINGIVFTYIVSGIGLLVNGAIVLALKEFRKFKYVPE